MAVEQPREWEERRRLNQAVGSHSFWWHSIDLGDGLVTPGYFHSLDDMAYFLECLQLPDLEGRSFLDIGAWDGYYSFAAERLGARRVVALDHYVWSLAMDASQPLPYWKLDPEGGVAVAKDPAAWRPDELPGKRGFEIAREALGSSVEPLVADFMDMDLSELGTFDVVLYSGVLYHMQNPFEAMRRVAATTGEVAVIETQAIAVPGLEEKALWEFFPFDELMDEPTNWWAPNAKALQGLCETVGFKRFELVAGPPAAESLTPGELHPYRAIAHAWKSA